MATTQETLFNNQGGFHYYMSNTPVPAGVEVKANTPSSFTVHPKNPLLFSDCDHWEVALWDIYIPGVHYNIYRPFNKNVLEVRKVKNYEEWRGTFQNFTEEDFFNSVPVASVTLPPGNYTPRNFCDAVNIAIQKEVFEQGVNDMKPTLIKELERKRTGGARRSKRTTGDHCPTEFSPDTLWDSATCGPIPDWWKSSAEIRKMDLKQIANPETEEEESALIEQGRNNLIALTHQLLDTAGRNLVKVKEPTSRLRFTLPAGYFVMCREPRVQKLLGWTSFSECMVEGNPIYVHQVNEGMATGTVYGNAAQMRFRNKLLPEPCDFGRNNRIVYVYSNLVKSSVVGVDCLPLLKIVNIADSSFKTPLFHASFENPQYVPLAQDQFTKVEFLLANDLGEEFPFQRGENCILCLHFRLKKGLKK